MSGWPRVRLGEVLRPAGEVVRVRENQEYPNFGIYSFGRGLFRKPPISGLATSASSLVKVKAGQFIYSRLFAFEGAYGLVGPEFDGAYVSNEYPVFDIDESRVVPRFLLAYVTLPTTWSAMARGSKGVGVRRQRVQPVQVLGSEMPLPPLTEQQRLVAQIESLQSEVEHVMGLQHDVDREVDALCRAVLASDPDAPPMRLRDLVSLRRPDVSVRADETYHFAGVYSFGRGVFVGERKSGLDFSYPKLTRLRAGDFVYPKLMAWEGAFGIVPRECDGLVVSTEFPVFELNRDRVLPEVVDTYFRDPALWPQIAGSSIGTNVRRRRLNPQDFLDHEMPVPTMAVQDRLRRVRAQVDLLKADRAASRTELDALMPAVLDRAFAGLL